MKKTLQVFNFAVRNQTDDTLEVHIDGDIVDASTQEILRNWYGDETSVSFKSLRDKLLASNAKTINIYVNSPGGHVGDAMAIHDLLKDMQAKGKTVNTEGRGIIASAATYILMAGNNPTMSANSWFMIHNVSGGIYGDVNTIENYSKTLRKFNDAVRDFYASATGMRKEDITKYMDNETWFTANEAKEKGFIKNVTSDAVFNSVIKPESWQFSNTAVLNAYNKAVQAPIPEDENTKSLIKNQFSEMKKFFEQMLNAIKGIQPANTAEGGAPVNLAEQIANTMQPHFESLATEIETQISNQVSQQREQLVKDVTTAVTDSFKETITNLQTANEDLKKELTTLKGGKTQSENKDDNTRAIGGFRKA
jgi:ATP-dependent Clp endopeptidase proteolytic subunit ClpP